MEMSILDASNDFSSLSNRIGRFKEDLCTKLNIDYTSQDFRLIFLDSIQQYLLSLTSYIRGFMELQQRTSPQEFLNILNVGITTVEEFKRSKIIYKFPIESLVTMVHFQIDSFFGMICEQNGTPCKGFYPRMKKVLGCTNIEETEKDGCKNTLQCLAFFRNSFHSSGRHIIDKKRWDGDTEPAIGHLDKVYSEDEMKIEFKHREVISYNWKSAFLLIDGCVEITQTIILDI